MENNNSNINKAPGDYEACTRAEVWANRLFLPCALKASLVAFCRATNGSKSLSNWPSIKDSLYPVSGSSHWGTFGKGVSRDHSCNGAITGREVVCDVTQPHFYTAVQTINSNCTKKATGNLFRIWDIYWLRKRKVYLFNHSGIYLC